MGFLLGFFFAVVCFSLSIAGDIVFIVNRDVDIEKLSKREIRKIFLKERKFIGSYKAVPINLPPENELRRVVESELLGMDREKLELFWNRKYLHGVEPPIVLSSERAVKSMVRRLKGAVGYIDEDHLGNSREFKIIYRIKRR